MQPEATAALQTFTAATQSDHRRSTPQTGTDSPGLVANQPGNPKLKPETSSELESGFETDLLQSPIALRFHALQEEHEGCAHRAADPGVGRRARSRSCSTTSARRRTGATRSRSTARNRRPPIELRWDVTVSGRTTTTSGSISAQDPSKCGTSREGAGQECEDLVLGAGTVTQQRKGDPLFIAVVSPLHVRRRERRRHHSGGRSAGRRHAQQGRRRLRQGHGVDSNRFRSLSAQPPHQRDCSTTSAAATRSTATTSSARRRRRRAATLRIRRRRFGCRRARSRSRMARSTNGTTYTTRLGYFSPSQFWKFRELSAVDRASRSRQPLLRSEHGSTFVFGLRNLHTWTSFTGVDPEAELWCDGRHERCCPSSDFNTSPPPTYFTFRLNLKY